MRPRPSRGPPRPSDAGSSPDARSRRIDVAGGRITGVITERGRIAARRVVVAGGVWSRLLLRDIGITLPQLKITNSVCRTEPVPDGPDITVRGPDFSMRRRADGGYTISTLSANIFQMTPDSFRFMREFGPALRKNWRTIRPRVGHRFVQEWRDMRRRAPDEVSAYEETRVLDPAPNVAMTDRALASLARVDKRFRNVRMAQRWAGMIDVTPDAVPVISKVPACGGLILATGFSGHGFGLGPGAGRLAADLATDATPVVDPSAFRFERFSDGSKIVPPDGRLGSKASHPPADASACRSRPRAPSVYARRRRPYRDTRPLACRTSQGSNHTGDDPLPSPFQLPAP